MLTLEQKELLKQQIVSSLRAEAEVCRIVIFGSFLSSSDPHDLDVAVFQDSSENYLPLAMKYRRKTRHIARQMPIDIIPLRANATEGFFMDEINSGEVIYERPD